MQYQVPQFIEVEDKIFGPLTLKQFIYIAGGGGLAFTFWNFLPSVIAAPLALASIGFALVLAFIQINKKPFIYMLEAGFMYVIRSKLYLWQANRKKKEAEKEKTDDTTSEVQVPALSENKLKDLAWSLDINEKLRVERAREAGELPV